MPTRPGSLVWPGMILAGLLLAAAVWAAWPAPSTQLVRLPNGEARPKAPHAEPPTPGVAEPRAVRPPRTRVAVLPQEAGDEPARGLARAGSPATEEIALDDGPAPVPSEAEVEGYVPESPEELGARPLPGTEATPAPPVAG